MSNTLKGISTVISSVIVYMICGGMFTWSNINNYYTSYLRSHDSPNMTLVDGLFLMPLISLVNTGFGPVGTILESYVGTKVIILLCLIMNVITNCILLNFTKLQYIYLAMVCTGIYVGLIWVPLMKNCWLYFPEKKGIISGLNLFSYGFSALIFTSLADKIINPNLLNPNKETGLFDKEISERTYLFLKYQAIIMFVGLVIALILEFDYKEEENEEKTKDVEMKEKLNIEDSSKKEEIVVKNPVAQAYCNHRVYQIILMNFNTMVFCMMISNVNRTFGQLYQIDAAFLSNLSRIYFLCNGVGRLIWGILFDKFSFKFLYGICLCIKLIVSATIFYAVKFPVIYSVEVCLCAIVLGGNVCLIMTLFPKIYGIKTSALISSIANAFGGLASMSSPILAKIIVKEKSDYKYLFWLGTCLGLISFGILISFKETKFVFKEEQKGDELKEQELIEK
jgi:hypothetical protein